MRKRPSSKVTVFAVDFVCFAEGVYALIFNGVFYGFSYCLCAYTKILLRCSKIQFALNSNP